MPHGTFSLLSHYLALQYKTFAKYFPVILCTSLIIFVLQSLRKAFPSLRHFVEQSLHKYFPLLLSSTKLAHNTSHPVLPWTIELLQKNTCTHRELLQAEVPTQKLLHKDSFYMQHVFLHAETFTHTYKSLYTKTLLHR